MGPNVIQRTGVTLPASGLHARLTRRREHAGMQETTNPILMPRGRAPRRVPLAPVAAVPLQVRWARDEADVRRAQRLRHAVFVRETGAQVTPPRGIPPGLDADLFDPFCEHLLVTAGDGGAAAVVGSCRCRWTRWPPAARPRRQP